MKNLYIISIFIVALTSCSSYKKMLIKNNSEITEIKKSNSVLEQEKKAIDVKIQQQEITLNSCEESVKNLSLENIKLDKVLDSLIQISDKEVTEVTKLFIAYSNKIAIICKNNPPPCVNAANGWMREKIVENDINNLANLKIENLTSSDGKKLMSLYSFFATNNQNAFLSNSNAEDKKAIIKMFQDAQRLYNIYSLLSEDIARLYLSSGSDLSAWKKSKEDFDKLTNELKNNRNVCRRGRHANGWIADWVNTGANKSLELLNKTNYYSNTVKIEKIKGVLSHFFNSLVKLQTNSQCKNCPFLPAEWQIGYGLIFETTADKLTEIINN